MSQDQLVNLGLNAGYVLCAIAIVAAVVMNFANALKDPKSLLKGAIGIVVLLVIFFIGYSMAPSEIGAITAKSFESTKVDPSTESAANTYKWVGGAMTTTLILVVIAVAGLIYSSVSRIAR